MALPKIAGDSIVTGCARQLSENGLSFYEDCERLGPIVRARAYHKRFYVVTGPSVVEEVLVKKAKSFHKPAMLRDLKMIFGDGLLTADGDLWKHRRRTIAPVFQTKRNAAYAKIMSENIARAVRAMTPGPRDVHVDAVDVCITNLTDAMLGVSDPELHAKIRDLATICREVVQELADHTRPWKWFFPKLVEERFAARLRELEDAIERLVQDRRASRTDEAKAKAEDFLGCLAFGQDLGGCPMGQQAIRDEAVTMLLAGHETAAAAVSWTLYLLARDRPTLVRLTDELDAVCGDRLPTFEDIPHLEWLDKVLLETYRLYPPTHRIGRSAAADVEIGGATIEQGADVLIPQWAIHRSERWFDAPTEFRPQRWTEELTERLPKFAYFPFSGGPRVCIGQSMVMVEVALLVGAIVKSFDISLQPGVRVAPVEGLTLLPGERGAMPVVLSRRQPDRRAFSSAPRSVPAPLSSTSILAVEDQDDDAS